MMDVFNTFSVSWRYSNKDGSHIRPFPKPLIRRLRPPNQCLCTWAYSPKILGAPETPNVLKFVYTICPVTDHANQI